MKEPSLEATLNLVEALCGDRVDKTGKRIYFHMVRCVETLKRQDKPLEVLNAMALHDVGGEDTCLKLSTLAEFGYSERTRWLTKMLTHDKEHMTYEDYINLIIAMGDIDLLDCKLSDNKDNMDPSRWDGLAGVRGAGYAWWTNRVLEVYGPARAKLLMARQHLLPNHSD